MKKNTILKINIEKPFGNLFREATVLIACKNANNNFIFGEKNNFYPQGIVRLIGGGVDKSETNLLTAVVRELSEEINYIPNENDIKKIDTVEIVATDKKMNIFNHKVHIFYVEIPKLVDIKAGDDVTGIKELDIDQFADLVLRYSKLSKKLDAFEGELNFSWFDYGQVYGPIHQIVLNFIKNMT